MEGYFKKLEVVKMEFWRTVRVFLVAGAIAGTSGWGMYQWRKAVLYQEAFKALAGGLPLYDVASMLAMDFGYPLPPMIDADVLMFEKQQAKFEEQGKAQEKAKRAKRKAVKK